MDDTYERIISVKNEVFVYKIPPRQSARGYKAADWTLDQPDWTGRMRIVEVKGKCLVKLEDKISGELFAEAPIDQYPGPSVESVVDSSRYFVIKIVHADNRHAFIGIGFSDRGDSFDFNVSLSDYFKRGLVADQAEKEKETSAPAAPPMDLSFKEGQTIKINFGNRSGGGSEPKPRTKGGMLGVGGGGVLLPPPPSPGGKIPAPSSGAKVGQVEHRQPAAAAVANAWSTQELKQTTTSHAPKTVNDWGDFSSGASVTPSPSKAWVQF